MSQTLKISEACSLALHTMVLLSVQPDKQFTTKEIAQILKGSVAHLSKVLQRLTKAGFINASRGPRGGFTLNVVPDEVTLLQIYEVIEGPYQTDQCLLGCPICTGDPCIFGGLLAKVNDEFYTHLSTTHLSALTSIFEGVHIDDETKNSQN